jgi:hypothetical protein
LLGRLCEAFDDFNLSDDVLVQGVEIFSVSLVHDGVENGLIGEAHWPGCEVGGFKFGEFMWTGWAVESDRGIEEIFRGLDFTAFVF